MKKRRIIAVTLITILTLSFLFAEIFPSAKGNEENVFNEFSYASGYFPIDLHGNIPENGAKSAIVIDLESGNIVFSKNADEKLGMASTTKIMTALVAIENSFPDDEFPIPKDAVGIEGSSVYLKEGEVLSIRELLYCLLLESGNDAATAIAILCGGSVDEFCKMMNERAEELSLQNTHFSNPHGLSDENHFTTARELAIITAEAMKYPLFCEIVLTKTHKVRYDGVENGRTLVNHNKLLKTYEGATGGKTGYTKKDGKCLVSSAKRDGLHLIAVTLGDPSPTVTHTQLLDSAFSDFESVEIVDENPIELELPVENGEDAFLTVRSDKRASVCLPKGSKIEVELMLPDVLSAPIKNGDVIGKAVCRYGEDKVYIINFESIENIKEKKKSFFQKYFGRQ